MDFSFLFSNRFWVLVIGGLGVVAKDNFTWQAWINGIIFVVVGFNAIRTVDRFSEKIGAKS